MATTSAPRKLRSALAFAAGLLLAFAAGGSVLADDMGVTIRDEGFSPAETTLHPVGAAVHWNNAGTQSHSVKFADGVESPVLAPGQTYQRTFAAAGDYTYTCGVHPQMTGIVHVVAAEPASTNDGASGATAPETDTASDVPSGPSMFAPVAIMLGSAVLGSWLVRRRLIAT
jgi:plastocyanin